MPELRASLALLEPLRRFRDERGRELLDVPRAALPRPRDRGPRPLPPQVGQRPDLGHADRTRILPEPYRKRVIGKNGDVAQTFLVDGLVAGTWTADKGRVELAPFGKLSRGDRQQLDEERGRLEAFLTN